MNQNTQNTTRALDTKCKECSTTITKENTAKSRLKRKSTECNHCFKKRNAKNNAKNNQKNNLTSEQKLHKLQQQQIKNRTKMTRTVIDSEIQKFIQLDPMNTIRFSSRWILSDKIKLDINTPTAIQSVMGTGKTKYIINIIKQAKENNLSVLYICPNISTINDTTKQLQEQGIHSVTYKETHLFEHNPVVLSTVDSCDSYLNADVLIVDEVYTVFEELAFKSYNPEMKKIDNKILAKYHKILTHKRPFILDRYINPVLKMFDAFQTGIFSETKPHKIILNEYKKQKQINLLIHKEQRQVKNEILKRIELKDEKITIHFSEQKSASSFFDEIENKDKGIYCSSIKDDIFGKRIKITTSSLSRGNSLNGEITYLIDSGRTVGVMTLLQMLDRNRNSTEINLYLKEGSTKNETSKALYNKYKELPQTDVVLRIREFLRMTNKMEKSHKEVLEFMIQDTYIQEIKIDNIHEIYFVDSLINANWDKWIYSGYSIESITDLLSERVKIQRKTIINRLKLKGILEM